MLRTIVALMCACALLPACGGDDGGGGGDDDGDGGGGGGDGGGAVDGRGRGDGGDGCGVLVGTVRDFTESHPDFEEVEARQGDDRGIVADDLGVDDKPVYDHDGSTRTVTDQASFDQWYRDVPGVNAAFEVPFAFTQTSPGIYVFEDLEFYPIDGRGLGDEGNPHNYHFTTEIHGTFRYRGGEVFTFTGDDDVFAFVNGKLALDLGGIHSVQTETIDFDARAGELGIVAGQVYSLDVFHAERHTVESNFRIETSIDCLVVD